MMNEASPVRRRWLRAAFVCLAVIAVLALLCLGGVMWLGRTLSMKGQEDARAAVVVLAQELNRLHSEEGALPESITPEELYARLFPRSNPAERWNYGHFDHDGYSIELAGEAQAFEGTRITYHGKPPQHPIVLTVGDLSAGDWTLEEFPHPAPWWQFWR